MEGDHLALLAAGRAIHFGSCLLILSVPLMERLVLRDAVQMTRHWERIASRIYLFAIPLAFLSGVAWFIVVAADMSEVPIVESLNLDTLSAVWTQTQFGRVWRLRFWALAITGVVAGCEVVLRSRQRTLGINRWMTLGFSSLVVASLAWSGHGGTGRAPMLHRATDVLHLLTSAVWPTGLLPLWLVVRHWSRATDARLAGNIGSVIRRFSRMSLAAVGLLALSGVINSVCLLNSFREVADTAYGRWLCIKVIVFLTMMSIGAANLLVHSPSLQTLSNKGDVSLFEAASGLLRNVALESSLAAAIFLIVGVLGMLMPS